MQIFDLICACLILRIEGYFFLFKINNITISETLYIPVTLHLFIRTGWLATLFVRPSVRTLLQMGGGTFCYPVEESAIITGVKETAVG